jgi:PAS domain S-box-containing protein
MIFNQDKALQWVNPGFKKLTGYTLEEIVAKRGKTIYEISSNPVIRDIVNECIRDKTSAVYESVIENKDGKSIWLSSTLNPIFSRDGRLMNLVVVDTDISYRKEMEEQIKESLEEKGLLLKEIHHRVKNNLQIIISLFNLQSGYVADEKAYKALREGQDRIKSMALIHERFYQADGTTRIDFDDYIRRLCDNLASSNGAGAGRIRFRYDLEKISLDIDSAVPCGLIINELVSNSIRHAFPGDRPGLISVSFRRTADTASACRPASICSKPIRWACNWSPRSPTSWKEPWP